MDQEAAANLSKSIFVTFYRIFKSEEWLSWMQIPLVIVNPLPPSDAVRKQKKNILEDLYSSVL